MSIPAKPYGIQLSGHSLSELDSRVAIPQYDRSRGVPKIVHIGVGGFNRSHLAVYLDDLLAAQASGHWAEFGVGLLPADQSLHDALAAQDFLYGVLERDTGIENYRVIGSLIGHHYAPSDSQAVIGAMSSQECAIISLTVTEGGYFLDAASRRFFENDAAIQQDLNTPSAPATWVGYVAEAASRRMQNGSGPFTLLSCDNLQSNGDAARQALLAFAGLRDGILQAWIEANVGFPNSMVDRITPRTTDADRELIAARFGIRDRAPVVTEPFRQWVLEDEFASGRPLWEKVGVKMTADVAPYEKTKMRLLNGGHFCIAYFAALLGIHTVAEAVSHTQLHKLLTQFLAEVRMTLHDLPGIDLQDYSATVLQRFANPTIGDQIARICSDGSAKVTKFILPSLLDLLTLHKAPRILPMVLASWLRYQLGITENGDRYTIADPGAHLLNKFVAEGARQASLALAVTQLFGDIHIQHPELASAIQQQLDNLQTLGVRATMEKALAQSERTAQ